ncbi:NUDIX hydrolase [Glacieibacterium megasporae]|uniref:NUDIX hydrolase n=1 Tax=Glacieibacterium megasporae TaxID=2835787 RepID=UPI002102DC3E|nr:NUDIX domain-containing protein [Polymorphobacter megasporae]
MLLITSRTTKRWIIPKGNPIRGLLPHLAAAREAFEEAGISGVVKAEAIGSYGYAKVINDGTTRAARVDVFPLAVLGRAKHWPEQHERVTEWFGLNDAANAVEEPELKLIIAAFRHPLPA